MIRPLIAGNWKMNGSKASIQNLLHDLISGIYDHGVELAVFPPSIYIDQVSQVLKGSLISWGSQNVCAKENGAFTGEISGNMLKDLQCRYVIVGHSERRNLFNETNEQVAAKFFAALRHGLLPILCVGETLNQRQQGETLSVIQQQLAAVLKLADNNPLLLEAIVAYEPVWAIGTGQNASPEQVQEVHSAIRAQLKGFNPMLGQGMRILYGGSVKPDNAAVIFAKDDVNGALVGGASLQAEQFLRIASQFQT